MPKLVTCLFVEKQQVAAPQTAGIDGCGDIEQCPRIARDVYTDLRKAVLNEAAAVEARRCAARVTVGLPDHREGIAGDFIREI